MSEKRMEAYRGPPVPVPQESSLPDSKRVIWCSNLRVVHPESVLDKAIRNCGIKYVQDWELHL